MTTLLGKSLTTDTANGTDPAIQPAIIHLNQATVPRQNDKNHSPIVSFNSGIEVNRSGREY